MGGPAGADAPAAPDRRPDPEGDQVPAGVPPVRGPGLPDPQPQRGDPLRRREPADPPGHPDRLQPDGGAVYPGRALHRSAPAGQRQVAGDAAEPAGPGQHPAGGGARRGHHAGGGLPDRHRSRRRHPRRRGGGRRYTGGGHGQPQQPDGSVSLRQEEDPRAGDPAAGQRQEPEGHRRGGEQPAAHRRGVPPGDLYRGYRRVRQRQELLGE